MRISLITTATRIEATVQRDGRLAVRERHAADSGEVEERTYLAESGSDLDAMLIANGRQFLARLSGES